MNSLAARGGRMWAELRQPGTQQEVWVLALVNSEVGNQMQTSTKKKYCWQNPSSTNTRTQVVHIYCSQNPLPTNAPTQLVKLCGPQHAEK